MMDEISKGFFYIPDFRHIFPIFDTLYGMPFVFRFTFLKVARKFAPPANFPGKGHAEEVALIIKTQGKPRGKPMRYEMRGLCVNMSIKYL
jgi:hypothetical protein